MGVLVVASARCRARTDDRCAKRRVALSLDATKLNARPAGPGGYVPPRPSETKVPAQHEGATTRSDASDQDAACKVIISWRHVISHDGPTWGNTLPPAAQAPARGIAALDEHYVALLAEDACAAAASEIARIPAIIEGLHE